MRTPALLRAPADEVRRARQGQLVVPQWYVGRRDSARSADRLAPFAESTEAPVTHRRLPSIRRYQLPFFAVSAFSSAHSRLVSRSTWLTRAAFSSFGDLC